MLEYLFKRIFRMLIMLLGITFLSFAVIRWAPGGPGQAGSDADWRMSPETRQKIAALYGTDKPVQEQYFAWLKNVSRLDFGRSFSDGEEVAAKIAKAAPVTLAIQGLSLLIVFAAGIFLGVYCALKKGRKSERILSALLMAAFSIPSFWLALLLMERFGVEWRWLPVSGLHSLFYEDLSPFQRFWDTVRHLVLPVLVISLPGTAALSRYVKANMLDALSQNYILSARARGLPESSVLWNHALRNALLPVITLLGLSLPGLLGGSVVLESLFSIPGMGRLFYASVYARDYPVIMGILVLGAVLTLAGNALADLAYGFADPRTRRARR